MEKWRILLCARIHHWFWGEGGFNFSFYSVQDCRCGCWPCWAEYAWPSQPPRAGQHTFLHGTSVTFWYLTHPLRKRPNSYLLYKLQIDHRYSRYRADAYCICSVSRSVWWGIYFISILQYFAQCHVKYPKLCAIKQFTWWVGLSVGSLWIKK